MLKIGLVDDDKAYIEQMKAYLKRFNEENYAAAHVMPNWQKLLYGVDAGIVIVLVVLELLMLRNYKKKKETVKAEHK